MSKSTECQLKACASLIQEHQLMELLLAELKQRLAEVASLTLEAVEAVQAIMAQIMSEMNIHFACEEQVLFPAVSPYHPMGLMEAEHEALIELRQEFLGLLGQTFVDIQNAAQLQALGSRFISEMLDHIGREDASVFPACEQALSDDQKQEVIRGMAQLRASEKTY